MKKVYIFIALISGLLINAQNKIKEGFDTEIPSSWMADPGGTDVKILFEADYGVTDKNGDGNIRFNKSYNATDTNAEGWLFTSKMQLEAGKSYDYSFYIKTNSYYGSKYKFTYGNAQNRTSQTTVLKEETSPVKLLNFTEVKGSFTATTTGEVYFAFQSPWSRGFFGLDEVLIRETPSCVDIEEVSLSNIKADKADASWQHNANNVVEYTVKVVSSGENVDAATAVFETTTAQKNTTITGLISQTLYDVYVKANCGNIDGESEWSKVKTFKTACGAVSSLSEDFSNRNADGFIDCWSKLIDKGQYNYSSIEVNYSDELNITNYYSNAGDKLLLITPELSNLQPSIGYQLRFKAKLYSSSTITEKIEVGTITNPSDKTTFTKLKEFDLTDEYQEFVVDFSTYTGSDKYIAFNRSTTQTAASITTNLDDVYWEALPVKWLGTSTNWKDASNWESGTIPTANESVTIKNGVSNYPEISDDVTVGSVFIESNANILIKETGSLNANSVSTSNNLVIKSNATSSGNLIANSVSGNITYKLYTNGEWQMVGSPVKEQSVPDFVNNSSLATGTVNTNHKGLAKYDSSNANPWSYYKDGDYWGNFEVAKGYAIKTNGVTTVDFIGKVNTDKKVIKTIYSDGFKLISNPYTASLSLNGNAEENFLANNSGKLNPANVGLYYWSATKNKYEVINNASTIKVLSPGQGFFVNPASSYENFTFSKSMLSTQLTPLLSKTSKQQTSVEITVQANNNKSQTEIKYLDVATNGLDKGYDAGFFNAKKTQLDLYSKLVDGSYKNTEFMLQCVNKNNLEQTEVPLGVRISGPSEVMFSANTLNLPEGIKVFLEDKQENKVVELTETYKVNLNSSSEDRFVVHTKKQAALSIENETLPNVSVYQLGNKLHINGLQSDKASVEIYNILGSKVFTTKILNSNTVNLTSMSQGIYLVKVNSNNKVATQKIILK